MEREDGQMIVYCELEECKNNKEGKCKNKYPIGTEAIGIETNWMGLPICSDYDYEPDEEGE